MRSHNHPNRGNESPATLQPPPPPRERKPRKAPPPQHPETPPEFPRTAKNRLWAEYREAQAFAHTQRRDHFSGLLGRFMRYHKRHYVR